MKIVQDFYNKSLSELDKKFFPNLTYYRDNDKCAKMHYQVELFNNGCLSYDKLLKRVSKLCNTTIEEVNVIFSNYILEF
jgi:hypothetical protein